jgi:hypothetical protein
LIEQMGAPVHFALFGANAAGAPICPNWSFPTKAGKWRFPTTFPESGTHVKAGKRQFPA